MMKLSLSCALPLFAVLALPGPPNALATHPRAPVYHPLP
jgi:hypothetical protein